MLPLDFHPKKSKGQNFLKDINILKKIVENLSVSKNSIVLEIGSGKGVLTEELSKKVKKVVAIELDRKLHCYLSDKFRNSENIQLYNKDILKFELDKFVKKNKINQKLVVVGNIPYSITTPILEYVFKNIQFINKAYLMAQKEFAKRLIAEPNSKDYSSLSCFAQFHVDANLLFHVNRTCFWPRPKVDSSFIELIPKKVNFWENSFNLKSKKLLFKIIKAAFSQRRKNILNSLSAVLGKQQMSQILDKLNIDFRKRAENLSIQDYIKISNLCFDYFNSRNIIG